ncbi:MAG: NAD-dependent deacetylase [bacterium]|nr:NAD-dependent deacetylase [bacterium]
MDLVHMLKEARRTVIFTGAGVSTLCGIPDFRGAEGLYKTLDGDRIFALDGFRADPTYYYEHARDFIYGLGDVAPGPVHRVCAALEEHGLVRGVVTQNIDMLHQRAGSRRVIELHGSPAQHVCPGCGVQESFAVVAPVVRAGGIPRCPDCAAVLKPAITFFGEMLPAGALETASAWAAEADLMLVLGSSLVVQPAASVPLLTVRAGGRLAVVNRDATPLDHLADWRGDDLGAFCDLVDRGLDPGSS